MNAQVIPIASTSDVDAAWAAYRLHRSREAVAPSLADNPSHVAESRRLHAIFMALYTGEDRSVVIPFRRKG